MIRLFEKVTIVFKGVNLGYVIPRYWETPTKRKFMFYGLQIGWVMIGVTVAKEAE